MAAAGAVAFKLFTGGVAPPGMYPGVTAGQILDAMRRVKLEDRTVVVHSENAPIVDFETARIKAEGRSDAAAWDEARPWFSELEAVQRVSLLAEVTGCRTVIAHVTAPRSVAAVRAARRRGADVWVETCPHYLCLTLEDMASDVRLKWNPPSRDRASVDRLWEQLRRGHVHTVGSDHAPLPKDPERRHLDAAAGRRQRPRDDAVDRRHGGASPSRRRPRHAGRRARHDAGAAVRPVPAKRDDPHRVGRRFRGRGDVRPPRPRRPRPRIPRASRPGRRSTVAKFASIPSTRSSAGG